MPTPLVNGLGGPSGFGEAFIPRNDDTYTGFIDLRSVFPGGLDFFGTVYTGLYLNNNGSVTFTNGIGQFTPGAITGDTSNPIIAPFWADVDTRLVSQPGGYEARVGTVTPTPGGSSTGSDIVWYDLDPAAHAFTATWDDVGYYAAHTDKLNAFQLRLVAVPTAGLYAGDFDIEFRYEAIGWVSGDASGGSGGLGGTPARIGYASGNGADFVELPQSGDQAALLGIAETGNTGLPGFYKFEVRNGAATPAISVGNVSVIEGNAPGQTYAAIPITLAARSATPITVSYATIDGSATASQDYTAQRGTVTFAPGTLQQIIFIPITSDTAVEPDDSFTIHLSDAVGAPIAGADGTVVILNDDGLTVADVAGLEGAGALTFTVRLLSPSARTVTVEYATSPSTARAGADYQATTGTLTFAPGETSRTVAVPLANDAVLESDETFQLVLSNPIDAALARDRATGTILNDDGLVIDDVSVAEGTGGTTAVTVVVRLLSSVDAPVTVLYATAPGTASAGTDYTPATGTITIPAGSTRATIAIAVMADSAVEANESFTVVLSGASGAAIARDTGTVSIVDDDGFVVNDVTVVEGTGGTSSAVFTVTLQSAVGATATVAYATMPGTASAGSDFTATGGTLTFAAGVTSMTVTVPIVSDSLPEADEGFFLTLFNPSSNAGILRATGRATIVNDDGLSISDAVVTEGDSGTRAVSLTVRLSAAATAPVTVGWATSDGTATAGSDYAASSGLLSFAAGETTKVISVLVHGDTLHEPDETFRVVLSNPVNTALVKGSGTITITNDDVRAPPVLTISPAAVSEGGPGGNTALVFLVSLSYAAASAVTVRYATTDGTAIAGSDYTATGGTLTIPAGSLYGTIGVPVTGDQAVEPDETLTVTLSQPLNASIGTAAATGTIRNDDARADLLPGGVQVEGQSGTTPFSYTVTITGDITVARTLRWAVTAAGTGPPFAAPSDFAGGAYPSGTLSLGAGQASATILVPVQGDTLVELDESFILSLSDPSAGLVLGTGSVTAVIANDDTEFAISANAASVAERLGPYLFTVTRSGNLAASQSVAYAVTGTGAAPASASDFPGNALPSGVLTFAPGAAAQTIQIPLLDDAAVEPDETFLVTLSNPGGGAGIGAASAAGTILNDDAQADLVRGGTQWEGQSGTTWFSYAVTVAGDIGVAHTIRWIASASGTGPSFAAAADFVGGAFPSGTLILPAGQASAAILVPVLGDTAVEDDEGFTLTLVDPSAGLVIGTGSAAAVIANDDTSFAIAADAASLPERMGPFPFTVTRAGNLAAVQSVSYAVAGAGPAPASASDFPGNAFPAGVLTFAPGVAAISIQIPVQDNAAFEPDETFRVTLSDATGGAVIATGTADAVIVNDDAPLSTVSIAAADAARREGDAGSTPFTFTVSRSTPEGAASVAYTVTGRTGDPATAPDFAGGVLPSGFVAFAPGETRKTIIVAVAADREFERDEGFTVTLSAPGANTLLGMASAAGTILNDDALPNFDAGYYLGAYSDLRAAFGTDAVAAFRHYMDSGWREGRNPSPGFDTAFYLAQNADVRMAGINPLEHYDGSGWREGRNPDALFDVRYYLARNPDVRAAGMDPLTHFESSGWREGRQPSLAFSTGAYLAANPDVARASINPLDHYLASGRAEGRSAIINGPTKGGAPGTIPGTILVDEAFAIGQVASIRPPTLDVAAWFHQTGWTLGVNPDAWFDTSYYLARNPDVKAAGIDPLAHFETSGWREGREPSLVFSGAKYLAAHPDVKAAGMDPLLHYVGNGRAEGRMSFLTGGAAPADPLVDAAFYDAQLGATLIPTGPAAAQQAAWSYDHGGWQAGLSPGAFFDTAYYLARNPDVAAAGINPLAHYESNGWREGRDPSARFSTARYLAANGDVRAAGLDPLLHYLVNGQAEGRIAFPA